MRSKNIIVGVLLVVLLSVSFDYGRIWAKEKAEISPAKIAVVNIRTVFENSSKSLQWQEKIRADETKYVEELRALSKEIDAIKATMETRKPDSDDYMQLGREGVEKQALLDAKRNFYQQEFARKGMQQTELLYQEIRSVVATVAKEKGLDMVMAKDDLEFPSGSMDDLMLTIRTSTVLYSSEPMDITADVLKALDGAN